MIRYVLRQRRQAGSGPTRPPRWLATVCRRAPGPDDVSRRVLVRRWSVRYAGTLVGCEGSTAIVTGRQATQGRSPIDELSRLELTPGSMVEVRWRAGGNFLARVTALDGAMVSVDYEDGSQDRVSLADVVAHLPAAQASLPPLSVAACPAARQQRQF